MLEELKIRNLAVVEDVTITFKYGLNVLSGATGAGKSIIMEAVELLSGRRARKSLIRGGADSLFVEGIFRVPEESTAIRDLLGMDGANDVLSIQREFTASGRSRIRINSTMSTGTVSREVTSSLIELHGQHGQQELLDQSRHVFFLDLTGNYDELLESCRLLNSTYRASWRRLQKLREEERENLRNEEFLRFQLRELDSLDLEQGIIEKLEMRIRKHRNIQRYRSALVDASRFLSGEGGALEKTGEAEKALRNILDINDKWKRISEELGTAFIALQETIREIDAEINIEEEVGDELELLQERLAAIQAAARKFRMDPEDLEVERKRIRDVLRELVEGSDKIEGARLDVKKVMMELVPALDRLSEKRIKTAERLDATVTSELEELGMKGAIFRTEIGKREIRAFSEENDELDLSGGGQDEVEFMIRTNIGEQLHPLAEVASGGELSRITLVLKKLLVGERRIPTMIFDEIDTGLGADMGEIVAGKLSELAGKYQVICITHLPQVAAKADHHIAVRKKISDGRTKTTASILSEDERTAEITRMLGGDGELRMKLAEELLHGGKSARSSAG